MFLPHWVLMLCRVPAWVFRMFYGKTPVVLPATEDLTEQIDNDAYAIYLQFRSCTRYEHLDACHVLVENFENKYPGSKKAIAHGRWLTSQIFDRQNEIIKNK